MLRLPARPRRLAVKSGCVLVLLLAVLPQVLYLGHQRNNTGSDSAVAAAAPGDHAHHDKAAAEHEGHCHVGPKGCAGADGIAKVALLSSLSSLVPDSLRFQAPESNESIDTFALWQRPDKPPRTA
jgi:hypothetical protein